MALCTDEARRVAECFAEPCEDDKAFAAKAQAVRNAAKSVGARVTVLYRDGKMYVQYAGQFVGLTDEQKAQRKAAAEANKAAKENAAKGATAKGGSRK